MELYEKISTEYLELNSCGEQIIDHQPRACFRKDGRVDHHLLYIIEGNCYLTKEGAEQKIEAGNLIYFRPHEPQCYRFSKEEYTISLYLHFSGVGCEAILKKCSITEPITKIGVDDKLIAAFSRLREEYLLKRQGYRLLCAALLAEFLGLIGRKINSEAFFPSPDIEDKMHKICQKMHRDYFENRPIAHYAAACFLSESRFTHAFKAHTGRSPKNYIALLKVDSALRLLETTRLPLHEIGRRIGVEDPNYFSRLIKKHTGHPPSYFRK